MLFICIALTSMLSAAKLDEAKWIWSSKQPQANEAVEFQNRIKENKGSYFIDKL